MEANEVIQNLTKIRQSVAILKVAKAEEKKKFDKKIARLLVLEETIYKEAENENSPQTQLFRDAFQLSPQDEELMENPLG